MDPRARRAREKFLSFFPRGFEDPKYLGWERDYKLRAHEQWDARLDPATFRELLRAGSAAEIAARAVALESRTNLLFSFEKMALRDAVRSPAGARAFARALHELVYGRGVLPGRFDRWVAALAALPRRQTRVLTWPLATVFGFIAQPELHFFVKPRVTKLAASDYGFALRYDSRPAWASYSEFLRLARTVKEDLADLKPRDMIDVQSFLWVQGSDEYENTSYPHLPLISASSTPPVRAWISSRRSRSPKGTASRTSMRIRRGRGRLRGDRGRQQLSLSKGRRPVEGRDRRRV